MKEITREQMQIKMCPLMRQAGYKAGFNPDTNSNYCIEERCSWWCIEHTRCSVLSIPYTLDSLKEVH